MYSSKLKFRLNVAGILQDPAGRILVCERLNNAGAWQFPQGGVDKGETLEIAVARELEEEIGVAPTQWDFVRQGGPYRYTFADGKQVRGFDGKDQHFFVLAYHGEPEAINVNMPNPEFCAYKWILPTEFDLACVPEMKRSMYKLVFQDLLGVELSLSPMQASLA